MNRTEVKASLEIEELLGDDRHRVEIEKSVIETTVSIRTKKEYTAEITSKEADNIERILLRHKLIKPTSDRVYRSFTMPKTIVFQVRWLH